MEAHWIETPRTARFYAAGPSEGFRESWLLLHGYGQLARDFLAACSALRADGRRLVAPEALSRFYLRGSRGEVGASWMTREDREREIRDTLRYLDAVVESAGGPGEEGALTVLGFSQGAAAAWRWAALGAFPVRRLIAWGGACPDDLDLDRARERLRGARIVRVAGARDPAYPDEVRAREGERLARHGLDRRLVTFDGGHELDPDTLRALAAGD